MRCETVWKVIGVVEGVLVVFGAELDLLTGGKPRGEEVVHDGAGAEDIGPVVDADEARFRAQDDAGLLDHLPAGRWPRALALIEHAAWQPPRPAGAFLTRAVPE